VQQRLQGLFGRSAQVTGFVAGCINCESSSYGVSVPDVDVVVNVDPQALAKLPLNGKTKADKAERTKKTVERLKKKLAKKMKQNRPLPQWFRFKTGTTIRYNSKRRNWRRTKLGF